MAVNVTVHQVAADTAGGTQTFAHGHGTTPDCVLVYAAKAASLETPRNHAQHFVGFYDGSTDQAHGISSENGQASTDDKYFIRLSGVFILTDTSATSVVGVAEITFDATNVTLTWSTTPTETWYLNFVVFSGTDGADHFRGDFGGGTQITVSHNLGLTVGNDALIFMLGSSVTASTNASGSDAGFGFGVAHWNGTTFTERCFHFMEDDAEADGRPAATLDTDDSFQAVTNAYALGFSANLGSFATNSYTLTASAANTMGVAFLTIGLPSDTEAWVGDIEAPTSLGSKEYSPLSWPPQVVGMLTSQIETRDSLRQNSDGDEAGAYGFSAADGTTEASSAIAIENDSATTDTQSVVSDEFVYMPAHDGTLTGSSASAGNGCRATLSSLDSDGWTIDTTGLSANSTQTYWIAWAIQGEEAAISRTATVTGAGTVSATAKKEISRTASMAGIGTVAATGALEISRIATAEGVGTVAAAGIREVQRASTSAGIGTVASAGVREVPRTGAAAGVATVTATGEIVGAVQRTAAITGLGTVFATSVRELQRAATITGVGLVAAVGGIPTTDRTAAITGAGTVAATGAREVPRGATIAGVGAVSSAGIHENVRIVTITANGTVAAVGAIPGGVVAENSDPPITGGGRVMSPGQWPHHWEPWEEPQPRISPPKIAPATPSRLAELIAEAAATLGMPRSAPIKVKPAPKPKPVRVAVSSKTSQPSPIIAEKPKQLVESSTVPELERMLRNLNRRTALLLLMKLLD